MSAVEYEFELPCRHCMQPRTGHYAEYRFLDGTAFYACNTQYNYYAKSKWAATCYDRMDEQLELDVTAPEANTRRYRSGTLAGFNGAGAVTREE